MGPVGPVSPCGPVGATAPVGPVGAIGPVSPCTPVAPCGPVGATAPVGPLIPMNEKLKKHACALLNGVTIGIKFSIVNVTQPLADESLDVTPVTLNIT